MCRRAPGHRGTAPILVRRRDCRGMVTAEAALVMPTMALLALALGWLLAVGISQVQVTDAARDAARAVARGDSSLAVRQAVERTAGPHARLRVQRSDGIVNVEVTDVVHAPGWLLVPIPSVTLHATSHVEDEADDVPPAR